MDEKIASILADLPSIRNIASEPMGRNPLLAIVLQQAMALSKIADWAQTCDMNAKSVQAAPPETPPESEIPTVAEVIGVPEKAVHLVPAGKPGKNGT